MSNSSPSPLVRALRAYKRLHLNTTIPAKAVRSPRNRALQLTAQQIDRLVAARARGATLEQLAAEFHVHSQTVSKHLHARGIVTNNKLAPEDAETVKRLYADGWSLSRIGERLGRDPVVVRNVLVRANIPRRDTHGRVRS